MLVWYRWSTDELSILYHLQISALIHLLRCKEAKHHCSHFAKVICELPTFPVPLNPGWTHLSDLPLPTLHLDPTFGEPERIDILLGVDITVDVRCHGRRTGPV